MKKNSLKTLALGVTFALAAGAASAAEGPVPTGIPHLDHVYVVVMENQAYGQIINNPNMAWTNQWANSANLATKYYAIAHPSLTNYLEMTGGSNFGVLNDNGPDWHNSSCTPNIVSASVSTDNPYVPASICPIAGTGTEAATPAIDMTNEAQGAPGDINIDGTASFPAMNNVIGKTIADQLVSRGKRWKTYQESLPLRGADGINSSDGVYDNTTDFSAITPTLTPPLTSASLVNLYAAKHNPFAYFASTQSNANPNNGLGSRTMAGFDGINGFYADLRSVWGPSLSYIVPNQCNDQHGRGNAGAFCNFNPSENGTQAGTNPALIHAGDVALQKIVTSIKSSPSWGIGHNAIVVVWDENDYAHSPVVNQVVAIVDTNYGPKGVKSAQFYTHYSLLKTLEAGLGLPCLNHACDSNVHVMSDLFGGAQ
jgi:hypothetical protein